MKITIMLGLVLLTALAVCGQAAELAIEGFSDAGELSWTDVHGSGSYTIEWSSSLTQTNWSSDWRQLSRIPATGGAMRVRVPMFFRVRHSTGAPAIAEGTEAPATRAIVTTAASAPAVASSAQRSASHGFSGEGSGSQAEPYRIASPAQLQEIGNSLSSHYVLACDVDLSGSAAWDSGKGFLPIGNRGQPFSGVLDGNGHKIRGLRIARFGIVTTDVALFGATAPEARIVNVSVQDAVVAGCDCVGILVGENQGTLMNCHVAGVVSGSGTFGGLVGGNDGRVSRCSAAVGVRPLWVGNHLGGLVGSNNKGTIQNSFAVGAVTGRENAGGLVGVNNGGIIERCYACVEVQSSFAGSNDSYRRAAGGLVAFNQGEGGIIRDCFAGGAVDGPAGLPVGLLAGAVGSQASIFNSYALSAGSGSTRAIGQVYSDAGPVEFATVPTAEAELFGGPDSPLRSWDFEHTWRVDRAAKPSPYPRLKGGPADE